MLRHMLSKAKHNKSQSGTCCQYLKAYLSEDDVKNASEEDGELNRMTDDVKNSLK
jgi:hypothetical protein